MRKRKAFVLALLLAAAQPGPSAGTVSAATAPLFSESFENGSNALFHPGDGAVTHHGDFAVGAAFRLTSTSEAATVVSRALPPVYLFNTALIGPDGYVETEFDVMVNNPPGTTVRTIRMNLASSNSFSSGGTTYVNTPVTSLLFKKGDPIGLINAVQGTNIFAPALQNETWYRIRVVVRLTDEGGSPVRRVCALYVDGTSVLTEDPGLFPAFASGDVNKIPYFDEITFSNPDTPGLELYVDNFTVTKYNGAGGAPVNRGALVSAIRAADKKLAAMAGWSGTLEYRRLAAQRDEAAALYGDGAATPEQIESAAALLAHSIDSFVIKAGSLTLRRVRLTDAGGAQTDAFAENGFVSGVLLTKNTAAVLPGQLVVAVYDESRRLVGIGMEELPAEAPAGDVEIPARVALPGNIAGIYAKAFVLDRTDSIQPLLAYYSTEEHYSASLPWSVYIKGTNFKMDADPVRSYTGEILVPASNVLPLLGIPLEVYGSSCYAQSDTGGSLAFYPGRRHALISGAPVALPASPVLYDGFLPMLAVSAIGDAFDISYAVDSANGRITFADRAAEPAYVSVSFPPGSLIPGKESVRYRIPHANPDARVEVWVKRSASNPPGTQFMSGGQWVGGYKGFRDNSALYYWRKAYAPRYEDGAFCGSFADLSAERKHDIRYRITENGVSTFYVAREAFTTLKNQSYSSLSAYVPQPGEDTLLLVPTFENMGYYINAGTGAVSCAVQYRKEGEQAWRSAYAPYYDSALRQYRGSIVNLLPGTVYEVKATVTGAAGARSVTAFQSTWQEEPVIAETIALSQLYDGSGALALDGFQGSPDGWIKVVGDGQTVVDAGRNSLEAVYLSDSRYLILENVTIRGGYRYGIHITDSVSDVRIVNCDIAGWGRRGVLNPVFGNYIADGGTVNYDAAIRIFGASNVVVERCYIHDSNGKTNAWKGETWESVHPAGIQGIYYYVKSGLVARYNSIIGSDSHRWNDGLEGWSNTAFEGGTGRDADIYGNMIAFGQDDGVEIDGGAMNVRVYQNRFEQLLCGISAAPVRVGPAYIFRNLITNLGDVNQTMNSSIKEGVISYGYGMQYIFHNTVDTYGHGVHGGGSEFHSVTRNNIFVTRQSNKFAFNNSYAGTYPNKGDDNNYDLLYGQFAGRSGDEARGIFAMPVYRDAPGGDYTLASASPGIDAGQYLDNFSDGETAGALPDMGAFEYGGGARFLPGLPVRMWADTYLVRIRAGESKAVSVSVGAVEGGRRYKIVKNDDFRWLRLSMEDGALEGGLAPNSTVTFTVSADASKLDSSSGRGMALFRLDNGYAIPITVIYDPY